jgi:hypothetical protein
MLGRLALQPPASPARSRVVAPRLSHQHEGISDEATPQPPGAAYGPYADGQGNDAIYERQLYQLVRQPDQVAIARSRLRSSTPAFGPTCSTFG